MANESKGRVVAHPMHEQRLRLIDACKNSRDGAITYVLLLDRLSRRFLYLNGLRRNG